jgi:hypothetical protein
MDINTGDGGVKAGLPALGGGGADVLHAVSSKANPMLVIAQ